jgi:hypothetical protein
MKTQVKKTTIFLTIWLQLILAQLHLILAQLTSLVANNPGSLRSCLQVGAFMFAGHNN